MHIKKNNKDNKTIIILVIILLIGFSLRIYSVNWGLPILIHPDESFRIGNALTYGQTLNFQPKGYSWPPFLSYLDFLFYGVFIVILLLVGRIHSIQEINTLFLTNQAQILPYFYIISRCMNVLFDVATIFVIYKIMKHLFGEKEGLFAAFIYAIFPTAMKEAHFATVESPMIFFMMLTLYFMVLYYKNHKSRFLYFASLALGFSIGCIYNAVAAFCIIVFFYIFDKQEKIPYKKTIIVLKEAFRKLLKNVPLIVFLFIVSIVAFCLINPYIVIRFNDASKEISALYIHVITKNMLTEGPQPNYLQSTVIKLLQLSFAMSISLFLIGIYSIYFFLKKADYKRMNIFLSFLIILISIFAIKTDFVRYLDPLLPFFAIFLGYFLGSLFIKNSKKYFFIKVIMLAAIIYTVCFSISIDATLEKESILGSALYINSLYDSNQSILATDATPFHLRTIPINNSLHANESELIAKNPGYVIISSEIYLSYPKGSTEDDFFIKLRGEKLNYCLQKTHSCNYLQKDLFLYLLREDPNTYVCPTIEIYKKC